MCWSLYSPPSLSRLFSCSLREPISPSLERFPASENPITLAAFFTPPRSPSFFPSPFCDTGSSMSSPFSTKRKEDGTIGMNADSVPDSAESVIVSSVKIIGFSHIHTFLIMRLLINTGLLVCGQKIEATRNMVCSTVES